MNFIKLHQNDQAFLVNLSNVSEVYTSGGNKSRLLLNFSSDSDQERITVDESLDEVLELIKQVSE